MSDGGPAFPTQREALDPRAVGFHTEDGMSLRAYLAGQIVVGLSVDVLTKNPLQTWNWDRIAEGAVKGADALIKELQNQTPEITK